MLPQQEVEQDGQAAAKSPFKTHRRLAALLALLLPLAVVLVVVAALTPRPAPGVNLVSYLAAPQPPRGAEVVYVGVEPIQIDSVSLETSTFDATFYIWWRWHGAIDPTTTTLVLNASTGSPDKYVTTYAYTDAQGVESPIKIGKDYNQTALVSVEVSSPFSLSRYPLDAQTLQIHLENNTYNYDQLVYVPDTAHLSKTPGFEVSGWQLNNDSLDGFLHHYSTNFGAPGPRLVNEQYSDLVYEIQVSRPFSHFLMKLLLPMFIVLLAGISALFVKTDDFDVRLAMAATGLLTLIFLQQGYAGDLPSTAPVVVMDEIYALAYAAVGATFLRVVYTTARLRVHHGSAEAYASTDHLMAALLSVGFVVGSALLVVL